VVIVVVIMVITITNIVKADMVVMEIVVVLTVMVDVVVIIDVILTVVEGVVTPDTVIDVEAFTTQEIADQTPTQIKINHQILTYPTA
jgi:hypothetical protein